MCVLLKSTRVRGKEIILALLTCLPRLVCAAAACGPCAAVDACCVGQTRTYFQFLRQNTSCFYGDLFFPLRINCIQVSSLSLSSDICLRHRMPQ